MPPRPTKPAAPTPYELAGTLYGDDFLVTDEASYTRAVQTWAAMGDAERSYALGHLQFLHLMALERVEARLVSLHQAVQVRGEQVATQLDGLVEGTAALANALSTLADADDDPESDEVDLDDDDVLVVEDGAP